MLSVHPRHVRNIVNGKKTIELRKTRPNVLPGQPVVIYETFPMSAVVATCRVARIVVVDVADLQHSVLKDACVSAAEIERYFRGRDTAYLIHLEEVRVLRDPVRLNDIRRNRAFAPPQTWHFLDRTAVERMLFEHPSKESITSLLGYSA
ncbi:ASCH domain-containing protein [Gordonia sp. DT219]|uniref:ASCH domain-containing protein n=1 Tax=Gordonia sp. DT219 TaxID=3416658 RepID=UPI003CE87063